ncbi:MAG TPA: TonB-dependent receptor [Steroidobacter sp.]|uniref:TonB-dependent receptor n=1 Tax=Steroidobacter sp. TaxID=1978227 RepID=UPI002ED91415
MAGMLLACQSALAGVDLSRVIRFEIPAQGLGAALLQFSRQAQVQIIVESRLAESLSTPTLNGEYARGSALEILLNGSGLTYRAVGNAAIAIQAAGAEDSRVQSASEQEDAEGGRADSERHTRSTLRIDDASEGMDPGELRDAPERLGEIVVVGTRRPDRSAADAPVPIDQIPLATLLHRSGQFEVGQIVQFAAPSFNSNRQVGADGADHIDSAALRGLGPDQTLVLVNGKRLHSVALVNVYGSRARGNTGTDLNTIPALAIERIDVLRDGAAAQYGSDAIAGVMNIGLKRSRQLELVAATGGYTRGDGENTQLAVNYGFDLGARGFMNLTGEYVERGPSNRNRDPCRPHREIGDASVENRTIYLNSAIGTGETGELYLHGGMQNRMGDASAYDRWGVDPPCGQSTHIPVRNSAAMYPDGFAPRIGTQVRDRTVTAGARTNVAGWKADLSGTHGRNSMEYIIANTLNASIANADLLAGGAGLSPTAFEAGGFSFDQSLINLDVTRYFASALEGINVAFGAETRRETYQIRAGERGSWDDYDGAGGGNAGSQGFPGFRPEDRVDRSRNASGAYVDVEAQFTDKFLFAAAARFEHYSDFGNAQIGKLASSYKINDSLRLRGSVSGGFRAPSLQQQYFSSTITNFVQGAPLDIVIAPNGSPIALAAGVSSLREEQSRNASLGLAYAPTASLSVTLDAYQVDVRDRIVLIQGIDTADLTSPSTAALRAVLESLNVARAQFLVNAVDTRTRGVDATVNHAAQLGAGTMTTFLGVNYNTNSITRVNPTSVLRAQGIDAFLSRRERLFIEGAAPESKAILSANYTLGRWDATVKLTHFGSLTLGTFSGETVPDQRYRPRTSVDLSLGYELDSTWKFTLGGTNIFDALPSPQDPNETDTNFTHESVQMGFNGAAWFARLSGNFR